MQANGIYKTIFLRSLTAFADRLGSARFIQFLDRDRRARVPSPWEPESDAPLSIDLQVLPLPLGFWCRTFSYYTCSGRILVSFRIG